MPRKKRSDGPKVLAIPQNARVELTDTMIRYAERKPELEGVMMHLARICELEPVIREIERLRGYAKRRNGKRVA